DGIVTGSLVNAKAVAEYIRREDPLKLSLVCMGFGGSRRSAEDELCALYIKSMLEGKKIEDFEERIEGLKTDGGERFFDRERQDVFPEKDFYMCSDTDRFDFVIKIERDGLGLISVREP
ncbi:MAG: 2-phosphosulfolactate phosphatase, partial [Lachnospiraceae bacterium]|nr:2-phosphosulfolactate phosphatase [Lachnospiraceae bacterium]